MKLIFIILMGTAMLSVARPPAVHAQEEAAADPASVTLGERLFLESRFAQYFFAHAAGPNADLVEGDPTLAVTTTATGSLPGPFAGRSMSCRACHLVDEHHLTAGGGNRTYADFASRSPVPARDDGDAATPRNSPSLVSIIPPAGPSGVFHFDGEFPTLVDLVAATFTGRNFGWLPHEHATAVAHIAAVIRGDDGRGALARAFGGSYRQVLAAARNVPEELHLAPERRLDVDRASDDHILHLVSTLVAAYLRSLSFATVDGAFDGSPFDAFLERNSIPRAPRSTQSALAYSRDVRDRLARRARLIVRDGPHRFALHDQPFAFGRKERRGLQIFLREHGRSRVGNCVACHPLPTFTDFRAHNTGVSQRAYDATHGEGSFVALAIPSLAARDATPDAFLPPTPQRPAASGRFRRRPAAGRPGEVDLGLWNVFANPDFPGRSHQRRLAAIACRSLEPSACRSVRGDTAGLLEATIAVFKTPGLRDLGHSDPYFHDGSAATLEEVVEFYRTTSELARAGLLRNAAPELAAIRLDPADVEPLAAFLRSLNEDYN